MLPSSGSSLLLQHSTLRLGQLRGEETPCGESARGKQDGHGFGDADERLENANAENSGQLTQGVQEPKRSGPG